jgi:XTP/dITP diphosphohydrolase
MTPLVVATGNPGKLKEMQAYLQALPVELRLKPDHLEVEETGETFLENACLKATIIAAATGQWAIADDSGLAVNALGGAPGVYSARYASTDADRIARLLDELAAQPSGDRSAQFVCAMAIARPDGSVALTTEGICPGEILHAPQGSDGFGYDPIFYVPQQGQSFAQMSEQSKNQISHRGRAFAQLMPELTELWA